MKMDELKRLAVNGQYQKAVSILDTIEIKKVKNVKDLYVIADIYVENEQYDKAIDLLVQLEKKIRSRRVVHQLIDINLKVRDVELVRKYMKEFARMAPADPYNYIFQYQLSLLEREEIGKQIEILEDLKKQEYMEKWAYELAIVYHRAGRDDDSLSECENIITWFGEGIYVEKAKQLKEKIKQKLESKDEVNALEIESLFKPTIRKTIEKEEVPTTVEENTAEKEISSMEEKEETYEDTISDTAITAEKEEAVEDEIEEKEDSFDAPLQEDRVETKPEKESRFINRENRKKESERPSYQSAFDFIEDMELKEEDDEIDKIIERAEKKKRAEQALMEKEDDTKVANEHEVKKLVEETTDNIASEIEAMFLEEENAHPKESLVDELAKMEKEVEENELLQEEIQEKALEIQEEVEHEIHYEQSHTENFQKETEEVKKQTSTEVIKEESQPKEEISEEVEQLIRKRRQRATLKKLNEYASACKNEDVDVTKPLGAYAKIHSVGENILRSLEYLFDVQNKKYICISGKTTFEETYLARRLAKLYSELNIVKSKKLLVLPCLQFVEIEFERYLEQIRDGLIIVEDVEVKSKKLFEQVQYLNDNGCTIILESHNTSAVQELSKQTIVIKISEFDVEEWYGFVTDFLDEKEYIMDESAVKACKEYIEKLLLDGKGDILNRILEKINHAYHCANRRNRVELRNVAELGNYEDAVFMIIRYTDFIA